MHPRSLCYMYCVLALKTCLAKGCKIKWQKNCKTTNRFKGQMKNNKTVLSLMQLNWETPSLLSRFPLSLTLVVIWTRVRKDGWVLCGAGCHSRVNGIGSEWWFWDLNRLSYSNVAWLKLLTLKLKEKYLFIHQLCVYRDMRHLDNLDWIQEAQTIVLGYASGNSYACFVSSQQTQIPACFISNGWWDVKWWRRKKQTRCGRWLKFVGP